MCSKTNTPGAKKAFIISATILVALTTLNLASAYTEIQCSADPAFNTNSCNQCFDWGAKWEWDNLWLLQDLWINDSAVDKILYKEEQEMPKMINLSPESVSWKENPGAAGFWEYTEDLNALYKQEEEWYILAKWQKVNWLKSKLGYAYTLDKNSANEWKNIWMLIYPISTHAISANGDISVDSNVHKECVLFKSWAPAKKEEVKVVAPEKKVVEVKKELPKTWPESILLIVLALALGFWIMQIRKRS